MAEVRRLTELEALRLEKSQLEVELAQQRLQQAIAACKLEDGQQISRDNQGWYVVGEEQVDG